MGESIIRKTHAFSKGNERKILDQKGFAQYLRKKPEGDDIIIETKSM